MKKRMNSMTDRIWALRGLLTVCCILAVFWCVSFISHAEPTKGSITSASVNVRETASTTATALTTLSMNDLVDVLAETTGDDGQKWYKITTESGVTGYVRADLIKKATVTVNVTQTDSKTAYIVGANANIRQDASTSSGRVANAQGGSKVTIIGEATGADGYKWYQIEFEGNGSTMTGFIRSDLVTFDAPVQEPEITEIEGEMGEGSEPESESESVSEPVEEPMEEPSESVDTNIPVSGTVADLVIMEPDSAIEILPEGFEQSELQLNEEIFTVWGKEQFYIIYASANGGEPQFYLYDSVNKSYVAYTGLLSHNDVAMPEDVEDKGFDFKLIAIICIVVIVILVIVIIILSYKLSNAGYRDDDDDDDYYDDEDVYIDDDSEDEFVDLSEDDVIDSSSNDEDDDMVHLGQEVAEIPVTVSDEQADNVSFDMPIYTATEEVHSEEQYFTEEVPVVADYIFEEQGIDETNALAQEEEPAIEDSFYEDEFEEEEEKPAKKSRKEKKEKKKKEKKKRSNRFIDYFTVEVDDDDEDDDDDYYDEDDYEESSKKKSSVKKFDDDDDDDDLNFIDL